VRTSGLESITSGSVFVSFCGMDTYTVLVGAAVGTIVGAAVGTAVIASRKSGDGTVVIASRTNLFSLGGIVGVAMGAIVGVALDAASVGTGVKIMPMGEMVGLALDAVGLSEPSVGTCVGSVGTAVSEVGTIVEGFPVPEGDRVLTVGTAVRVTVGSGVGTSTRGSGTP